MDNVRYLRGPGAQRAPRPPKPSPTRPEPFPVDDGFRQRGTYWGETAAGKPIIVNPNLCLICHKHAHADTAHHAFEPDTAWPAAAEGLGWPLPEPDRLL